MSPKMLKQYLENLESPDHPSLGPNIRGLQFMGLYLNAGGKYKYRYIFIHFFATMFVLSQYIELWLIRSDLEVALRNLSISMLSTVCVIKAWTCVFWQKSWKDIISSVSCYEIDQISKNEKDKSTYMNEYIKYSRIVTYMYWTLVLATVLTVIMAPLASYLSSGDKVLMANGSLSYPEIMSSWLPFDKTRSYGYCVYILEHAVICFYGGGIVATYDSNAVVLMSFFTGQMKILQLDCARLFGDTVVVGDEEANERIRKSHYQHLFLMKYSKKFNSLLSPVLFIYIIICSLMICASAVQLTMEGTTTMQQLWIAEYLLALIAQLFLYCWHGNEVYFMSAQVEKGVYSSAWWTRNVRLRRSVLLLGGQLRKNVVFTAGPFTTLTIPTFVTILKGSYSYYAILSKNGD